MKATASVPYVPRKAPAVTPAERLRMKRRYEAAVGDHIASVVITLAFSVFVLWLGVQFLKFLFF
jgi:hypothetical protein